MARRRSILSLVPIPIKLPVANKDNPENMISLNLKKYSTSNTKFNYLNFISLIDGCGVGDGQHETQYNKDFHFRV